MSKKVAYYGIFTSLAILMGHIEALFPIPLPMPGMKLGLSNVIVLLALCIMGAKDAFGISAIRVLISALLFKGFLGFWYSLAGAILSFAVMAIALKSPKISIVGVSILGGVFHNIGQIIVAWVILGRSTVIYLTPILMVCGVLTGFGIGIVVKYCRAHIEKKMI